MKFCVKLGKDTTDTYKKIQKAFGNDSVSHAQVFRWHKDFTNRWEMVEDEPWSGRPILSWKLRHKQETEQIPENLENKNCDEKNINIFWISPLAALHFRWNTILFLMGHLDSHLASWNRVPRWKDEFNWRQNRPEGPTTEAEEAKEE
jgi:hypothetical protein